MKNTFDLRLANFKDKDLVFYWSNDKLVRSNSFDKTKILYSKHTNWFKKSLKKKNIFIFTRNNKPIGLIRFSDFNRGIKISYLLSLENRRKKFGYKMLNYFYDKIKKIRTFKNKKIYAFIIKNNVASKKSLLRSGFKYLGLRYKQNCYFRKINDN